MSRLEGLTAMVTGAASGIGLGTARLFAEEGANVVLADVNEQLLKQEVDNLQSEGLSVTRSTLDVTKKEAWAHTVQCALNTYHKIDILVNNAGIHRPDKLLDTELDVWHNVMDANATSVFLGMQQTIPHMQQLGKGQSLTSFSGGIDRQWCSCWKRDSVQCFKRSCPCANDTRRQPLCQRSDSCECHFPRSY